MNNPGSLSGTLDPTLLGRLKNIRYSLFSVKREIYYLDSLISSIMHNYDLLHLLSNANDEELNTILSSIDNPKMFQERLEIALDSKTNLESSERSALLLVNNGKSVFSYNDIINFLKDYQYIPA